MQRRSFLQTSLSLGTLATAGCLSSIGGQMGVNKKLEIRNNQKETITLHVVVEQNKPAGSQNRETIFEENLAVPPNQTTVREVLGDDQFRITVTGLDQEMTFWTRPICGAARTTIIVTKTGELQNEVEGCE